MLLAAGAMLPTVWLPDLKALSYLGFLGVGASITVLGAVAYTFLSGAAQEDTGCMCLYRRLGWLSPEFSFCLNVMGVGATTTVCLAPSRTFASGVELRMPCMWRVPLPIGNVDQHWTWGHVCNRQ